MAQSLMDMLQEMTPPERLPSMLEKTKADVAGFNANPRAYSEEQKMDIVARAKQLGLDYSQGKNLDKATTSEKWTAGIGGALDAALFGILKDSWYSDQRTEKYKNAGKLAGTVGSLFLPTGWIGGAGKGLKAGLGTLGALGSVGRISKVANVAKVTGSAMKYEDVISAAKASLEAAKIAHKSMNTAETAAQLKLALDVVRKTKQAVVPFSKATKAFGYTKTVTSYKDALAAANEARQAATAVQYIKAAQRLRIGLGAAGNAGLEDTQRPYEDQMQMMQYLQQLQGYQQNVLGQ